MEIIYRDITTIRKAENNPRTISDEQLHKLQKSIQDNPDYFEARPIILSDRTGELIIIAGNQRYEACLQLGIKEVPTVLIPNLTEDREREIIIRDNVNNGEWNMKLLTNWDVAELKDWGMDLPKEWEGIDEDIENDKSAESLRGHSDKTELRIQFDTDTYATVMETLRSFDEKEDVALLKVLGLYE